MSQSGAEHYQLQLIQLNEDGSAIVTVWAVTPGWADGLRMSMGPPDMESLAPADVVDEICEAGEGRVVISE